MAHLSPMKEQIDLGYGRVFAGGAVFLTAKTYFWP